MFESCLIAVQSLIPPNFQSITVDVINTTSFILWARRPVLQFYSR